MNRIEFRWCASDFENERRGGSEERLLRGFVDLFRDLSTWEGRREGRRVLQTWASRGRFLVPLERLQVVKYHFITINPFLILYFPPVFEPIYWQLVLVRIVR